MNESTTITRQELYAAVWKRPVSELAKGYGVSEYILWNICKSHDIPRPGLHYWHRLKSGITPPQPPLPSSQSTDVIAITPSNADKQLRAAIVEPEALKGRNLDDLTIEFSADLSHAHKLIRAARNALTNGRTNYRGAVERTWPHEMPLDIEVTPPQVPRALAFMNGMIRALEGLGFKVDGTHVHVGEDKVRFGVYEKVDRKKLKSEKYGPKAAYIANGVLAFRIISFKSFAWPDRPGVPLESQAKTLIKQILLTPERVKAHQAACEESRRQREECWAREREALRLHQERLAEVQRREQAEQQRRQKLEQAADNWECARRINAFLDECAKTITRPPSYEALRFLDWAKRHAERLDPFQNNYVQNAITELANANKPITDSAAPSPSPNQSGPTSGQV
jgi:hypothetical protein